MSALNEVGARLVGESAALAAGGEPAAEGPAAEGGPAIDATFVPGDAEAPADAPRAETLEVSGDVGALRPGSGSPAAPVGMDIMYETEPPSEMPAHGGASSDPIPETEAVAAGGAELEPALDGAAEPTEPAAAEPAADAADRRGPAARGGRAR